MTDSLNKAPVFAGHIYIHHCYWQRATERDREREREREKDREREREREVEENRLISSAHLRVLPRQALVGRADFSIWWCVVISCVIRRGRIRVEGHAHLRSQPNPEHRGQLLTEKSHRTLQVLSPIFTVFFLLRQRQQQRFGIYFATVLFMLTLNQQIMIFSQVSSMGRNTGILFRLKRFIVLFVNGWEAKCKQIQNKS